MRATDSSTMSEALGGRSTRRERRDRRFPGRPMVLAGIVLVGVVAAVVFSFYAQHTRTPAAPVTAPAPARDAAPSRPAFTPSEEAYIRTLGPIHVGVEHTTLRLTLGQIFYLNRDLDRTELKRRVEMAAAAYRDAVKRLRMLRPPASLQSRHDDYVAAVRLFQSSTAEVQKMFQTGEEEAHLRAAYPSAQEGADKIREIGQYFWPGEHPPH